jgi:(R,R)-butanediol dehydrogenase/meso-butanediol dehydrogenase/diacetyl reductase/L-iditol 2-dehydrogenase
MKTVMTTRIGSLKDPDPAKKGVVEVCDMPLRKLGDGELLIKVAYCAICGSDPHSIEGIFGQPAPFGMGHEISGVVAEVGPNANINGFKPGDRVSGNFRHTCGTCYFCQNNMEQFCRSGGPGSPGMAEYVIWHEKQAVKLPDDVSLKTGCILEPVSIAVRAMDKANIKFGQNVIVLGGGPIGLLTLQLANIYGAANLTISEPIASRRDIAVKYGAKHVIDPLTQNLAEEALKITDGRGFDILFEVSGVPKSAEAMQTIAAPYANLIYVAQYARDYNMPVNMWDMLYMKEVTMTGIFVSPYTFSRTAQIIGRLDLEDMTSKVFDLDDAPAAFDAHMTGKYPKVLIKCNSDLE